MGQHFHYRYTLQTSLAVGDHEYTAKPLFNKDVIEFDNEKLKSINDYIEQPNKYKKSELLLYEVL